MSWHFTFVANPYIQQRPNSLLFPWWRTIKSHDAIQDAFTSIMKNLAFYVFHEQIHVLPPPSIQSFCQWIAQHLFLPLLYRSWFQKQVLILVLFLFYFFDETLDLILKLVFRIFKTFNYGHFHKKIKVGST